MEPAISIIIPFYNTPKLRMMKCLDSISRQTFEDFEVLVIDDGSEESYEDLKTSFEQADGRIRFYRKEHAGVSAARNYGLALARGEFICFVDSDDYAERVYLECLYQAIQDADLAICGLEEQDFPVERGWENHRLFFSLPERYASIQYLNFCHNKLFRASVIREQALRFPEGVALGEDALFLARYFRHIRTIRCISERLYHYVPEESSAVNRFHPDFWLWEQQVIRAQWELFHQYPLSGTQEPHLHRFLYTKLKHALYYYIDRCQDRADTDTALHEILSDPLYTELMQYPVNRHTAVFNGKDRVILHLWRLFGLWGVKLTRKLALLTR